MKPAGGKIRRAGFLSLGGVLLTSVYCWEAAQKIKHPGATGPITFPNPWGPPPCRSAGQVKESGDHSRVEKGQWRKSDQKSDLFLAQLKQWRKESGNHSRVEKGQWRKSDQKSDLFLAQLCH